MTQVRLARLRAGRNEMRRNDPHNIIARKERPNPGEVEPESQKAEKWTKDKATTEDTQCSTVETLVMNLYRPLRPRNLCHLERHFLSPIYFKISFHSVCVIAMLIALNTSKIRMSHSSTKKYRKNSLCQKFNLLYQLCRIKIDFFS